MRNPGGAHKHRRSFVAVVHVRRAGSTVHHPTSGSGSPMRRCFGVVLDKMAECGSCWWWCRGGKVLRASVPLHFVAVHLPLGRVSAEFDGRTTHVLETFARELANPLSGSISTFAICRPMTRAARPPLLTLRLLTKLVPVLHAASARRLRTSQEKCKHIVAGAKPKTHEPLAALSVSERELQENWSCTFTSIVCKSLVSASP